MTDSDNFAEGMREGHGLSDGCGEGILDKLDELDGSSSTKNRLSMTNVLVVSTLIPLGFPASESTTSKEPSGYTSTTLCKILPAMERSAKDGRDNGTSIGLMDSVGWTDGSIDGWLDTDDALEGASKMDGWSKGANDGILDKLGAFDGSSLVHEKISPIFNLPVETLTSTKIELDSRHPNQSHQNTRQVWTQQRCCLNPREQ